MRNRRRRDAPIRRFSRRSNRTVPSSSYFPSELLSLVRFGGQTVGGFLPVGNCHTAIVYGCKKGVILFENIDYHVIVVIFIIKQCAA